MGGVSVCVMRMERRLLVVGSSSLSTEVDPAVGSGTSSSVFVFVVFFFRAGEEGR